jgi:F0F1-type ATP synthase membrane subunit b/b'
MSSHHDDGPRITDSETLLRRAVDLIVSARAMPLSSSVVINRDEIVELLEEAANRLPEELRQARWMLKEREEFHRRTRREADDILDASRAQAERMVQRTEIVKAAEQRGRQIVESAEAHASKIRLEAEDWCDQQLAKFEIVLDRLTKTVIAGREKLSGTGSLRPASVVSEPEPAPAALNETAVFFDQDQS